MTKRPKTRCPLTAHFANGGKCCVGCGKSFRANPSSRSLISPVKARQILSEGKVKGHRLTPAQRGFFGARASGSPLLSNPPAGAKRIGRVLQIRYDRDQGNRRGMYYHNFRRRAVGLWTNPDGTVSIR